MKKVLVAKTQVDNGKKVFLAGSVISGLSDKECEKLVKLQCAEWTEHTPNVDITNEDVFSFLQEKTSMSDAEIKDIISIHKLKNVGNLFSLRGEDFFVLKNVTPEKVKKFLSEINQ